MIDWGLVGRLVLTAVVLAGTFFGFGGYAVRNTLHGDPHPLRGGCAVLVFLTLLLALIWR